MNAAFQFKLLDLSFFHLKPLTLKYEKLELSGVHFGLSP